MPVLTPTTGTNLQSQEPDEVFGGVQIVDELLGVLVAAGKVADGEARGHLQLQVVLAQPPHEGLCRVVQ